MMEHVTILDEPHLEFRYAQALAEPHDGLSAFGPYDGDTASHPDNLSIAVVGIDRGIEDFIRFAEILAGPVLGDPTRPHLWPTYPGFEAVFDCAWPTRPTWVARVDSDKLQAAVTQRDPSQRVYDAVDLYLSGIQRIAQRDERFDLIVCVVPDVVYQNCRVKSTIAEPTGEHIDRRRASTRRTGQLEFFAEWPDDMYELSLDFRNQLKARAMAFGIPIQIIRASTLSLLPNGARRDLTLLSDRAWNLGVAAYYKGGGKPWRLMGARDGVCYLGLAYRRKDPTADSRSACCAAQMFLDSGDGIVFLGESGAWYSPERRQFHLKGFA